MKITQEMVMELNNELINKGCPFRYEYENNTTSGNPHIKITLPSMNYVSSFIINPEREFFDWLKLWFKIRGIELYFNNDGMICWSKNGCGDRVSEEVVMQIKQYYVYTARGFGNVIVVQPDYLNKNENDYVMVITYCNKKFGYIHNIPRSAILSENKKLDEDEKKNLVDYITKKLDLE